MGSELNDAERRLWEAFAHGTQVDLGPGEPAAPEFTVDGWGPDRTVRAEVIARLLLGAHQGEPGYVAKVVLSGARITGQLNLNGGEVGYEVTLDRCWFDETPDLGDASGKGLFATNCRFPGLNAWNLKVSLAQFGGSRFTGPVLLTGSRISGDLDFSGARLANPGDTALNAQDVSVDGSVFCGSGFEAEGVIDLNGMKVQGRLDMTGARLDNAGGICVDAYQVIVERDAAFSEVNAQGQIHLRLARIGGMLGLDNIKIERPPPGNDGTVFQGELLTVGQAIVCRSSAIDGAFEIGFAKIGTGIDLSGTVIENPGGFSIIAEGISGGDFRCIDDFRAVGTINLISARLDRLALQSGRLAAAETEVDLYQATVGTLDITEGALAGRMHLSGLTYQRIPLLPIKKLLRWLRNDPDGYHPQPYEQLATYYRANGDDREARRTLLAKRRAHRRYLGRPQPWWRWIRKVPGWAMDGLAGYGYAPGRAVFWLAVALGTGTWVLRDALPPDRLTEPTASRTGNAFLLAADSLVPTSPFGLRDAAELTGTALVTAIVLQVLGYALSIAVLPAVTRALSRSEK
ncbi:pentapeptide repeat-containing protein [Allorhizocola rhizosphaerae]|uniref:pentapeptide repeat-containing protein n=1 Tax=Allorhizocola rhizosphaerae TaxID=1872709 RepID=UPI000E3D68C6|nr:pentapeptide repeat-containing protein [Allorhizocola rhizosphaerae]